MNRKHSEVLAFVCATLLVTGCSRPPPATQPDTRAQNEMEIRNASMAWSEAARAKDPEKFASFYTDDAVVMFGGAPNVSGKAAIREQIGQLMQDPAFMLSWQIEGMEVARSGELAIELDSYAFTATDAQSKNPVTEKGHGLVVWKKQTDGWKAYRDVPVADPGDTNGAPQ